jgi:hypothetical protein
MTAQPEPAWGSQHRRMASLLQRDPGFDDLEETSQMPWPWPGSAEEVWDYAPAVAVPFRPLGESVPADRWPEIHPEVHRALEKCSADGKVAFGPSLVLRRERNGNQRALP